MDITGQDPEVSMDTYLLDDDVLEVMHNTVSTTAIDLEFYDDNTKIAKVFIKSN